MSNKRILVIDDEADFLDVIKKRLEANNYEVFTASDGAEGLEKVRSLKPDAVLLDILMPGIDGIEVLQRIRKENKVLPVFMLTAFSDDSRFKSANKYHASGYIVKTNDLKKEIDNIKNFLNISDKYKASKK